jgi:hypothetical protein
MSMNVPDFTHAQQIESYAPPTAVPTPPPPPRVPLFAHWAPPDRQRRARVCSTAAQTAAAEAAAQRAAPPGPEALAELAQARERLENARHAVASCVNADTVADNPRQMW